MGHLRYLVIVLIFGIGLILFKKSALKKIKKKKNKIMEPVKYLKENLNVEPFFVCYIITEKPDSRLDNPCHIHNLKDIKVVVN